MWASRITFLFNIPLWQVNVQIVKKWTVSSNKISFSYILNLWKKWKIFLWLTVHSVTLQWHQESRLAVWLGLWLWRRLLIFKYCFVWAS